MHIPVVDSFVLSSANDRSFMAIKMFYRERLLLEIVYFLDIHYNTLYIIHNLVT